MLRKPLRMSEWSYSMRTGCSRKLLRPLSRRGSPPPANRARRPCPFAATLLHEVKGIRASGRPPHASDCRPAPACPEGQRVLRPRETAGDEEAPVNANPPAPGPSRPHQENRCPQYRQVAHRRATISPPCSRKATATTRRSRERSSRARSSPSRRMSRSSTSASRPRARRPQGIHRPRPRPRAGRRRYRGSLSGARRECARRSGHLARQGAPRGKLGQARKAFEANEKVDGVIFNQVKGGFTVDLDGPWRSCRAARSTSARSAT